MRIKVAFIVLSCGLAGCATAPSDATTCTNLISGMGGLLKFCQDANRLSVTESGMVGSVEKGDLKIVDDPETLAKLTRDIAPRPEFLKSRRLIARACLVKGDVYASIRLSDLRRITGNQKSIASPDAM